MANTVLEEISPRLVRALWPGAIQAWSEPEPPQMYFCGGGSELNSSVLMADGAGGSPYCWDPELEEWDAM